MGSRGVMGLVRRRGEAHGGAAAGARFDAGTPCPATVLKHEARCSLSLVPGANPWLSAPLGLSAPLFSPLSGREYGGVCDESFALSCCGLTLGGTRLFLLFPTSTPYYYQLKTDHKVYIRACT